MEDTLHTIASGKPQTRPNEDSPASFHFPEHGGDARPFDLTPIDSSELLDFSVCLNPLGPPESLPRAIQNALHSVPRYPSPQAQPLKEKLASHHGLEPSQFVVAHGSTQLIYALPDLWPKDKSVCIVAPAFSEYEKTFESKGVETHFFLLRPEEDFELRWDRLQSTLNSIHNLGGVVIGHPASPGGTLFHLDVLEKLIHFTKSHDLYLAIDETFVDFTSRSQTLFRFLTEHPRLILVRTFTKFFSIPGIRLGYGIVSRQTQTRLEKILPPWSVGSLELAIGEACLSELDYINNTSALLAEERQFLGDALGSFKDITVFPSESCSLLFRLTRDAISPRDLFAQMLQDGILIRNCGNFRGLDERFFRTGIRSRAENETLIQCLKEHLE